MSSVRKLWAFFILLPVPLFAQSYQGEVRGLVTDANHAAIVGAKVTLIDEAKRVSRVAVSDSAGEYIFNQVDPATYEIDIESAGFKKFARTGVSVETQQLVTVDAALVIGAASDTVEVTAEGPQLDATNGSTSTTLNVQQLADLPTSTTNGRSQYTVINVSQNVLPVIRGSAFIDQSDISTVSIAGSPESTNLYLIDGVPITDTINRPVLIPATEATQELKVQVTTYDAEVGRTGGGVYNTLIKSGTNVLHGSLYGVTSQSEFNANDFFNNRNGVPRPNSTVYSWASSIGGPVFLPRIYDGRNRTFFFVAEEGFSDNSGTLTPQYIVPTDLERKGDFSQSGVTIYNPYSYTTNPDGSVTRNPVPGNNLNNIPQFNPNGVGAQIVNLGYPHVSNQNAAPGTVNYTTPSHGTVDLGDEFVGKIDEQFFKWWSANVSYLHYYCKIPFGDALATIPGSGSITYNRHVDATNLNNIFTLNPTTVVSVRFGFNRFPNTIYPLSTGYDPTDLGLSNYNYQFKFFPPVSVTNFTPLSAATATEDFWYSRNLFTQIAKEAGKHSLKAGFDFRGIYLAFTDYSSAPGNFTFSGQFTQSSPTAQNSGGSAVADLLLGLPISGAIEQSQKFYQLIHYWGAYVQDEYRITPRLTIDAGLRYEYETGLKDSNNNLVTGFNTTVASPLAAYQAGTVGGLEFAGTGGRNETGQLSKLKFAPRLGFSYALGSKTTIRGGGGIYYSPLRYDATAALQSGFTSQTPLISSNDNYNTVASAFSLNDPFPGGPQAPQGSSAGLLTGIGDPIAAYDSQIKSPVIYQFSAGIQRQLAAKILLEADYVGSRGHHLLPSPQGGGSASPAGGGRTNIDQLNPSFYPNGVPVAGLSNQVTNPFYQEGGPGLIGQQKVAQSQLLLPFPQFASVNVITTDSASSYNSFAVRTERKFSSGLAFLATYTWSRNYDGSYETSSPSGGSNVGPQNIYDLKSEWGRSFINVPNRFTFAGSYVLPFGRGARFFNTAGWWNRAIADWQLNATTYYESGFPLPITQNNLNSSIGAAVQRPNAATGVSPKTSGSVYSRVNGFINPAAFQAVPEYSFGTIPKAIAERGPAPGSGNWDAALLKSVPVVERVNVTFRAEVQNVLNHPWFALPNTTLGSGSFGTITSTYNTPRSIQLGGRITF